jgi:hypothetical protein
MLQSSDAGGGFDGDKNTTKYEYNTKHDLVKITPPSPLGVTELTYDAIDRVNSSHPFKFGYETGDDNRESILYPNGILQCYKTDPRDA